MNFYYPIVWNFKESPTGSAKFLPKQSQKLKGKKKKSKKRGKRK